MKTDDTYRRLALALSEDEVNRRDLMEAVRSKYITSPRDAELAEGFKFVLGRTVDIINAREKGQFVEGRALIVVANSGAGKSKSMEHLFTNHPSLANYGEFSCPVIRVVVKSPCTLKRLGTALLRKLGYPLNADRNENVVWDMVFQKLASLPQKIIFFDEMQNMTTTATTDQAKKIRDTLKTLLNSDEHPTCLILAGLPELADFMAFDTQTRRRAHIIAFEPLTASDRPGLKKTIKMLTDIAELKPELPVDLTARLIHAALDQLGFAIEMIQDAIEVALTKCAPNLTIEHFAEQFAIRTKNHAPMNPFVAQNWHEIDCSQIQLKSRSDNQTPAAPSDRRRLTPKP